MSSPYRDVEIIKQIMKILDKTIDELKDLLSELQIEDEDDKAYRVTLKDKGMKQ
jgi:hypothetical protein